MKTARFTARKNFTFTGPYNGNATFDGLEHVVKVQIRDAIAEVLQRHGYSLTDSDSFLELQDREAFR